MSKPGRRRFISLLVYKIYKHATRHRTDVAPARLAFMAPRGSSGTDGARRAGREESAHRGTSKGPEGARAGGTPVVCRFSGAGPWTKCADDADDPRHIREGPSDVDRRRCERPRGRALVRPRFRREGVWDSPPWPV